MSFTRAQVEVELVSRVGGVLTAAGLDGVTVNGANASLTGSLGYGVRKLGYALATAGVVTDADIANVTDARADEFLDLAELRALMSAQGNYNLVDLKVGPRSESFSQLGTRLEKMIDHKLKFIELEYGRGLAEITAGVLTLDFEQRSDVLSQLTLPN